MSAAGKKKKPRPTGTTKRGKPRRRNPGAGRPSATDVVRVQHDGGGRLGIYFSTDMIDRLIALCPYAESLRRYDHPEEPYKNYRLQFARLIDMSIPGFFVRVEPPSFDPRGYRFARCDGGFGARVRCRILASRLGVDASKLVACVPELLFDEKVDAMGGGMVVLLPDECMIFDGPKHRPLTVDALSERVR